MSDGPWLERMVALRMVTRDPERLARFYGEALGAEPNDRVAIAPDECRLLGVTGGVRLPLRVGSFAIELDRFDEAGRGYPPDADAADLRFQHFAVIVADIRATFDRATAAGAVPISRDGPVTLPASAGGVTAVKLRDPDGHPFEFLQFPAGSGTPWRAVAPNRTGVLGVDHTAISAADAARSRTFYEVAGLVPGDASLNQGPTQGSLDGLSLESVDVVPMLPAVATPHLELLGYHGVGARSVEAVDIADVAATRTVWASDRDMLLRDSDGHRHQLRTSGAQAR